MNVAFDTAPLVRHEWLVIVVVGVGAMVLMDSSAWCCAGCTSTDGGVRASAVTTPPFEQGPIRPPSEAHSLLVRVIRNCTWNRCTFCPVYKGTKSSLRPVEDVLADVDAMAAAAEVLRGARRRRRARGPGAAGGVPGRAVPARRRRARSFCRTPTRAP